MSKQIRRLISNEPVETLCDGELAGLAVSTGVVKLLLLTVHAPAEDRFQLDSDCQGLVDVRCSVQSSSRARTPEGEPLCPEAKAMSLLRVH